MKTPKPVPGTQVHLVLVDRSPNPPKPTWVLDAVVIDTFWWETDERAFSVLVPGSEVPTRLILMSDVVSVNGEIVRGWDDMPMEYSRTWTVDGSKGNVYVVKFNGHDWHCQCKGFSYNRKCKHVDQVRSTFKT